MKAIWHSVFLVLMILALPMVVAPQGISSSKWAPCLIGQTWARGICLGYPTRLTWTEAARACAVFSREAGVARFALPSREELAMAVVQSPVSARQGPDAMLLWTRDTEGNQVFAMDIIHIRAVSVASDDLALARCLRLDP